MFVLLSPAKTFAKPPKVKPSLCTEPRLLGVSRPIVETALLMSDHERQRMLSLSPKLSIEARQHWQEFATGQGGLGRAAELYSGMVFRQLQAALFDEEQWRYAETHLAICSFVYGLLRPADLIRPYRMEGMVRLLDGVRVFDFWRDHLTPLLIAQVKHVGGTLVYLASEEMKQLFHWEQVTREVRVVTPTFLVRQEDGTLKQIVIYTKMARGIMAREIITRQLSDPACLHELIPHGFVYQDTDPATAQMIYVLD